MMQPQVLVGVGIVSRVDGARLEGERHYSFLLVPRRVEDPDSGPVAIDSHVQLRGREPLQLEGQRLVLTAANGCVVHFRIVDVSDTPPHLHTTVVDSWPADAQAD
jgi:hypothetical protein